jgi:hypothetical protein
MTAQKPITVTQSRFLEIVNDLSLRFPIAEIHEKTGIDKGTISKVLNKKLDPSDNFLSSFSKGFGLPPMIYTQSSSDNKLRLVGSQTDEERLLAEKDATIKRLESDNAWLRSQIKKLMGTNERQKG